MAQPKELVMTVAEYANKRGVWNVSKFQYSSWLTISDRLLNEDEITAYTIKSLAHYVNGDVDEFLKSAQKLINIAETYQTYNIYLTATHCNGKLEKALDIFDEHFDIISTDEELCIRNLFNYSRWALDNSVLKKCYSKFNINTQEKYEYQMNKTIKFNSRDLAMLKAANIDKNLFLEVMGVASKTMCSLGNFGINFQLEQNNPNDDLVIAIYSEDIDIDTMNELNEAWLNNIVDHETEYAFQDLSRLLVSFRPISLDKEPTDAN